MGQAIRKNMNTIKTMMDASGLENTLTARCHRIKLEWEPVHLGFRLKDTRNGKLHSFSKIYIYIYI